LTPKPTTVSIPTEKPSEIQVTITVIDMSPTLQITKTPPATTAVTITSTPVFVQTPNRSNVAIYISGVILLVVALLAVVKFRKH
jgi:hypothetical protein